MMSTYHALVHQRLNDMREESRDIILPDLRLVAGDFQPHSDLHIPKLPHELVLLRVLTQPSMEEGYRKVGVR